MCDCIRVLQTPNAEKELRHVPADKARVVLGNGKRMLFDIVFVANGGACKEVTLHCPCCDAKWQVRLAEKCEVGEV